MKKRRTLLMSGILALALICVPVAAIGTSSILSQLSSQSRFDSFFSGYTSGTGDTTYSPGTTTGSTVSFSERISALLNSDSIHEWEDDLPVYTPQEREDYAISPIPMFVSTCTSCSQNSPFYFT